MKTTDPAITAVQVFNQDVSRVWKAITEVAEMREWFFDNIPTFEAKVGFHTQFEVVSDNRTFTHLWEVVEVIPLRRLKYAWRYQEYQGDSFVTFELSEINNQTLLTLTTEIVEDFPESIPEFKAESCQAGWDYFIKQRLKDYLES